MLFAFVVAFCYYVILLLLLVFVFVVLLPHVPARTIYTGKNVTWITGWVFCLCFSLAAEDNSIWHFEIKGEKIRGGLVKFQKPEQLQKNSS